jgi:hypothetical protein
VEAAAGVLPGDAVVIFNDALGSALLAPPLMLLHARESVVARFGPDTASALEELSAAAGARGRPVYYVAVYDEPPDTPPPAAFTLGTFGFRREAEIAFDVPILELSFDGIPEDGVRLRAKGFVYRVTSASP